MCDTYDTRVAISKDGKHGGEGKKKRIKWDLHRRTMTIATRLRYLRVAGNNKAHQIQTRVYNLRDFSLTFTIECVLKYRYLRKYFIR